MLAQPSKPVTSLVATISYSGNRVTTCLPAIDEDFRKLVRSLGYRWDGSRWARTIIPEFHGSAVDRAAELGRELLAAGFPVDFPDEITRDKAISGDYEPEHTRWVAARTSGRYTGWFAVQWSRREDYYHEARKLHGSRYDPPHVVVPPDSFEEVEDFAEMNDFRLSPGAQKIIAEQREKRLNALVVDLKPLPPKKAKPDRESYGVDDELLDEPFTASDTGS